MDEVAVIHHFDRRAFLDERLKGILAKVVMLANPVAPEDDFIFHYPLVKMMFSAAMPSSCRLVRECGVIELKRLSIVKP